MDRRRFLTSLAGASVAPGALGALAGALGTAACVAGPQAGPQRRLRILMLGGTNFVGPHLVRAALDAGHEVTLFNRGRTNPDLFPELELLRGDRYADRGAGLAALEGERTWDAVFDTWQAAPGCVDLTARLVEDRVERYVYVSSIATYRNYRERGMTEDGPLLEASDHLDSFDEELGYSMRKRAGEQAVEARFGERGVVLRCTSVQGSNYGPNQDAQGDYWGYRFLLGEPLLAPDDPTARFQLIDAQDLAAFAVRAVEQGYGGAFNMVGPEEPLPLPDYIDAWSRVTERRSPIVWADPAWLREQGVRVFEDIRNWIPGDEREPGFYEISNARSLAHGLTYRPLETTIRDIAASLGDPSSLEAPSTGMSRERELELIERWQATAGVS